MAKTTKKPAKTEVNTKTEKPYSQTNSLNVEYHLFKYDGGYFFTDRKTSKKKDAERVSLPTGYKVVEGNHGVLSLEKTK